MENSLLLDLHSNLSTSAMGGILTSSAPSSPHFSQRHLKKNALHINKLEEEAESRGWMDIQEYGVLASRDSTLPDDMLM